MKTILIFLSAMFLAIVTKSDLGPTDVESYAKASGKKVDDTYFFEITKEQWEHVNAGRRFMGKSVLPFDQVNSDVYINRSYASDLINSISHEIKEATDTDPTPSQIFFSIELGIKKFKKLGFNPYKVKDPDLKFKAAMAEKLEEERIKMKKKEEEAIKPPPPLPTDGRNPVPIRYQTPKPSEHR